MFLERIHNIRKSLSFRLTLGYALIFTVSSLLVLLIFSVRMEHLTVRNTDRDISSELSEFTELFKENGMEQVERGMKLESASEGPHNVFFRLISENGQVLVSSNMASWGPIDVSYEHLLRSFTDRKPVFLTMKLPGQKHETRMVYSRIGPSLVMQIGVSLESNERYLHVFRRLIFRLLLPVFLFAAIVGWFMAQRALSGVDEVSRIAGEISEGAYHKRVDVRHRSMEIDRLADSFNKMVDRLQTLIQGMKEVTDNIAHDLRSPLTRIRGIAETTLMARGSDKDYEDMAVTTIEECDNLIVMINTMLDIAETEAGVGEMHPENVDVSRLTLDACNLFQSIAQEKSLRLSAEVPRSVTMQSDKSKIQRIIANLLDNAIKYTLPGGSIRIKIEDHGGTVSMIFEDTGIGIPPSDIPRVFERFYRCDASRSEPGIGLGLSLVKAIAEAFGGSVSVRSSLHKGSIFTVILPRESASGT